MTENAQSMTPDHFPIDDRVGAFVPHGRFVVPPLADGPLAGLSFAAKDVFDVAGQPTGAGNPMWLATHPIPVAHAALVQRLLESGAALHGKTLTDELAYSIHGDNIHYGLPINAAAPERIPGGSSSGSAAAVAAGLVDFALGTDTGGSTRVPASYCGLWGIRTTHGLVPRDGLVPLHPMFDTATWLARSASVFERVGAAVLPASDWRPARRIVLEDACAQADADFAAPVEAVRAALADVIDGAETAACVAPKSLEDWRQVYVTAGAHEGWAVHGEWISTHEPAFAPPIAGRWRAASQVGAAAAAEARESMAVIRSRVRDLIGADGVAVLPSAASVAPRRDADPAAIEDTRMRTMRICCVAGLAGLPQVSIPLRSAAGLPVGVSLLGPVGSDLALIRLAIRVHEILSAKCGNLCRTI